MRSSSSRALQRRLPVGGLFAPLVAVLCLAALLGGDLFRGIHLLAARHVLCAEHGELVHADDVGALDVSRPAAPDAEALPGGPGGHHHDHCDVAAARPRASSAVVLRAPLVACSPFRASMLPTPVLAAVCGVAVLAYAPKQSPPVLG